MREEKGEIERARQETTVCEGGEGDIDSYREQDMKQQCVREEKGEIDRESKTGSNSV